MYIYVHKGTNGIDEPETNKCMAKRNATRSKHILVLN